MSFINRANPARHERQSSTPNMLLDQYIGSNWIDERSGMNDCWIASVVHCLIVTPPSLEGILTEFPLKWGCCGDFNKFPLHLRGLMGILTKFTWELSSCTGAVYVCTTSDLRVPNKIPPGGKGTGMVNGGRSHHYKYVPNESEQHNYLIMNVLYMLLTWSAPLVITQWSLHHIQSLSYCVCAYTSEETSRSARVQVVLTPLSCSNHPTHQLS